MNTNTTNLSATLNNNTAPKSRKPRTNKPEPEATPAWELDATRYGALGQEMATSAVQQVAAAGSYWDRCRTLYVEAQNHGKAQEALDCLFGPGEKVKGKKAPWFRTYKSILSNALLHGVTLTDDMGMSAAQQAVKAAKDEATDSDAEASAAKDEQLVGMFTKLAQGCLNRGIAKSKLATILKGLEAA